MAEDAADTKERLWNPHDWCWDPYNMLALASDSKGVAGAGKAAAACFAFQPQLGPAASLLLDDVNRSACRGKGPAVCQVHGCSADLAGLKEYHQRYKICEFHLKVNSIIREGRRQRFCQQCGRFHDLTCFDGDKRSCRARLQRHNARRRKKADAEGSSKLGAKKPPTPVARKASREVASSNSSKQKQSSEATLENTPRGSLDISSRLQLTKESGSMERAANIRNLISSGRSSEEGASGQQLAVRLQSSSFASEQVHVGGFSEADAGQMVGQQSSLPSITNYEVPPPTYAAESSMETLDCLQDVNFFAPQHSSPMPDYSDLSHAAAEMQATFAADPAAMDVGVAGLSSGNSTAYLVEEARALLSYTGQYQAKEYTAEEHFTRMSAKMFKCTPEQLPADLKANLLAMLQCGVNALEGYIRPGCVHLTMHAMVGPDAGASLQGMGVRTLVDHLVAASDHTLWRSETLLIQWYEEVALVRNGRVLHVLSAAGSRGVLPQLHSVSPLAFPSSAPATLKLLGSNLATPDNTVLAQSQGVNVAIDVVTAEAHLEGAPEEASSMLEVAVPAGQRSGVLHLEVARGALLSGPKPVLMMDDAAAAEEINQLADGNSPGMDVNGFLLDLGQVFELKNAVAAAKFGASKPVRAFSAADVARIAHIARRHLIVAINKGWLNVARLVLPVAAADAASVAEAVHKVEALTDGLSLLHLAVRSQSAPLVEMLLEWTSTGGYELRAATPGPHGLTALHLAAVLKDSGKLAALLTGLCVDGAAAWTGSAAAGASPADLAIAMGNHSTHELVYDQLCSTVAAATKDEETTDNSLIDEEEDEFEVDPETGEVLDYGHRTVRARGGTVDDGGAAAMKEPELKSHPNVVESSIPAAQAPIDLLKTSACGALRMDTSSMTSGSSSDATSVLSEWPSQDTTDSLGLRKRSPSVPSVSEGHKRVEYTPEEKGRANGRPVGYGALYGATGLKVAPTVFDRTSAIGSALLIAACGGLTLFLRYCGSIFLD